MYRSLDVDEIIATLERLEHRIAERFPSSGLKGVCAELGAVARETRERSAWIARPQLGLRLGVISLVGLMLIALAYSIATLEVTWGRFTVAELVQVTEAGINELIVIGAALVFLVSAEKRIKRARALTALHELRVIAHVIDMHQLTKDPAGILGKVVVTASSPARMMDGYALGRYLDYCSEMLSLTGKIAALYAQNLRDADVAAAVNEVETLSTSLSRKIWQKIMMLGRYQE